MFGDYLEDPLVSYNFINDTEGFVTHTMTEFTCLDNFCLEPFQPSYTHSSIGFSPQSISQSFTFTNFYPVCIPDSSLFSNDILNINFNETYLNRPLSFIFHSSSDHYRSSFDTYNLTLLQFGFYGEYLKAISDLNYSAKLPIGELEYLTDVQLKFLSCDLSHEIYIDGLVVTIPKAKSLNCSLELTAFDEKFETFFILETINDCNLEVICDTENVYDISIVQAKIVIIDDLYANYNFHEIISDFGLVDVKEDEAILYVPLIGRTNVKVDVVNIGGKTASCTPIFYTNILPEYTSLESIECWKGTNIFYKLNYYDENQDEVIFTSVDLEITQDGYLNYNCGDTLQNKSYTITLNVNHI